MKYISVFLRVSALIGALFCFAPGCRRLTVPSQQQANALAPVATAAPTVTVDSAGPVAVEAPAISHAPAESAAPVVTPAPRAEAGRDVLQEILTQVEALQKTVQQQGVAMGGLADKIGSVENLQNVVSQFDLSEKQLELRKAELAAAGEREARLWRTLVLICIGLAGAVLVAAGLDAPADKLFGVVPTKLILIAAGLVFLLVAGAAAAGILP